MILADTSIWIDHLRQADATLAERLGRQQILSHPFVIGELALGSLKARTQVIGELKRLPQAVVARDDEVLAFIEARSLAGQGIGYIDAHLLSSVLITHGTQLWTRDKRLNEIARSLSLAAS